MKSLSNWWPTKKSPTDPIEQSQESSSVAPSLFLWWLNPGANLKQGYLLSIINQHVAWKVSAIRVRVSLNTTGRLPCLVVLPSLIVIFFAVLSFLAERRLVYIKDNTIKVLKYKIRRQRGSITGYYLIPIINYLMRLWVDIQPERIICRIDRRRQKDRVSM